MVGKITRHGQNFAFFRWHIIMNNQDQGWCPATRAGCERAQPQAAGARWRCRCSLQGAAAGRFLVVLDRRRTSPLALEKGDVMSQKSQKGMFCSPRQGRNFDHSALHHASRALSRNGGAKPGPHSAERAASGARRPHSLRPITTVPKAKSAPTHATPNAPPLRSLSQCIRTCQSHLLLLPRATRRGRGARPGWQAQPPDRPANLQRRRAEVRTPGAGTAKCQMA